MNAIRRPAEPAGGTPDFTEGTDPKPVRSGPPSSIRDIRAIRGSPRPVDGRRGATLPIVMGLVVVLTLFGAGMLASAGATRLDAIRRQQSLQCFWGAESALALVRHRLFNEPSYRQSPTPIVFTSGLMRADAQVVRSGDLYTVTARGSNTANRLGRRIQQEFQLQQFGYWDDFALFAGVGGGDMGQSVSIYGDVFCEGDLRMMQTAAIFECLYCKGSLNMSQSAVVHDEAYIGGTISLKNSSTIEGGSYPFSSPANPYYIVQPTVPVLDSSYYNSMPPIAAVSNSGLNFGANINLAGQTKFVQGAASLQQVKTLTSSPGGGILVVRDSFSLQQSCQIGPNVTVICGGNFEMGQSTRIGTNALVYSGTRINMKQSGIISSRAALITPGIIDMKQAAQASGFLYAGQDLDISQTITIQGLAYAKNRADLSQGVMITYNKSVLPFNFPPGIQTNDAVTMTPRKWREL